MITLDSHLLSLFNRDLISADDAVEHAQDSTAMRDKLASLGVEMKVL